ncbi:hypothetical protein Vretifemale_7850 [Volvox reticuliferus]|uniref:RRM domain-containing protein n=1 Tax=Volvox reticuliferus TaxID=1737510 RepID=A0A8J4C9M5_9CHLO|nr:hypothetical protein Vretifemale_7850 [Volvox reticuliferus]
MRARRPRRRPSAATPVAKQPRQSQRAAPLLPTRLSPPPPFQGQRRSSSWQQPQLQQQAQQRGESEAGSIPHTGRRSGSTSTMPPHDRPGVPHVAAVAGPPMMPLIAAPPPAGASGAPGAASTGGALVPVEAPGPYTQMQGHPAWAWGAVPVWQAPPGTAATLPYGATGPATPGTLPPGPVSAAAVPAPGYMAVPVMLGPGQAMAAAESAQYGMQYVVYQQGMPYVPWSYGYYPYNAGVIPFGSGGLTPTGSIDGVVSSMANSAGVPDRPGGSAASSGASSGLARRNRGASVGDVADSTPPGSFGAGTALQGFGSFGSSPMSARTQRRGSYDAQQQQQGGASASLGGPGVTSLGRRSQADSGPQQETGTASHLPRQGSMGGASSKELPRQQQPQQQQLRNQTVVIPNTAAGAAAVIPVPGGAATSVATSRQSTGTPTVPNVSPSSSLERKPVVQEHTSEEEQGLSNVSASATGAVQLQPPPPAPGQAKPDSRETAAAAAAIAAVTAAAGAATASSTACVALSSVAGSDSSPNELVERGALPASNTKDPSAGPTIEGKQPRQIQVPSSLQQSASSSSLSVPPPPPAPSPEPAETPEPPACSVAETLAAEPAGASAVVAAESCQSRAAQPLVIAAGNNGSSAGQVRDATLKRPVMVSPPVSPFITPAHSSAGPAVGTMIPGPSPAVTAGGVTDSEDDPRVVYVGHLPQNTDEHALYFAFSKFGNVLHIQIMRDKETGACRGYGFVTFESAQHASSAMRGLNGQPLPGLPFSVDRRPLRVAPAVKSQDRRPSIVSLQSNGSSGLLHRQGSSGYFPRHPQQQQPLGLGTARYGSQSGQQQQQAQQQNSHVAGQPAVSEGVAGVAPALTGSSTVGITTAAPASGPVPPPPPPVGMPLGSLPMAQQPPLPALHHTQQHSSGTLQPGRPAASGSPAQSRTGSSAAPGAGLFSSRHQHQQRGSQGYGGGGGSGGSPYQSFGGVPSHQQHQHHVLPAAVLQGAAPHGYQPGAVAPGMPLVAAAAGGASGGYGSAGQPPPPPLNRQRSTGAQHPHHHQQHEASAYESHTTEAGQNPQSQSQVQQSSQPHMVVYYGQPSGANPYFYGPHQNQYGMYGVTHQAAAGAASLAQSSPGPYYFAAAPMSYMAYGGQDVAAPPPVVYTRHASQHATQQLSHGHGDASALGAPTPGGGGSARHDAIGGVKQQAPVSARGEAGTGGSR